MPSSIALLCSTSLCTSPLMDRLLASEELFVELLSRSEAKLAPFQDSLYDDFKRCLILNRRLQEKAVAKNDAAQKGRGRRFQRPEFASLCHS